MDSPQPEEAAVEPDPMPLGRIPTALVVSGSGLIAAATLAGVSATLITWGHLSFSGTVTLAQILFAATFGCGVDVEPNADFGVGGEAEFEYHMVPLFFTLITFAVMIRVFRSLTTPYSNARPAVTVAGLVGVAVGAFVLVSSLLLESDLATIVPSRSDDAAPVRVDRMEALTFPPLVVAAVLLVSCLLRRDWLRGIWLSLHDWFAVPVRGLVCFLWMIPVAGGLVWLLLLAGVGFDAAWRDSEDLIAFSVGAQLVFLAHSGVMAIGVGSGAPYGTEVDYVDASSRGIDLDRDYNENSMERLLSMSESEPLLLGLPLVTTVAIVVSVRFVITRSPTERRVAGDLTRWLVVLAAALPVLGYATAFRFHSRASASLEGVGPVYRSIGHSYVGVDFLQFTGLVLLVAAVSSLLMFVIYSDMDRLGDPRNRTGMRWTPDRSPPQSG